MDLKIDAAKWRKRRGMDRLLDALGAGEGLTRYVGGAVRDDLLSLAVNDVDLATRLLPAEVTERLGKATIKAVPTGIDHGTITAVVAGEPVEVTTLRKDVSTDGRRAVVAFTEDWQEDAARRDFTINALSADPVSGEIFDYFGGLDDLLDRRVRFIGDPLQRIAEDHLRILRFFRFHARFGTGEPDREALAACTERANDLMALSRERIADELLKLLGLPDPSTTVGIMVAREILVPVLPEIAAERLVDLTRLIAAEGEAGVAADALRRIVALLPRQPELADEIGARLRLSNAARKRLACAADPNVEGPVEALAYRAGVACAVDRLLLANRPADAGALRDWTSPRLPITGGALIKRGLTAGPVVAATMRRIEEDWIEAGFVTGDRFETIVADAIADARS